jgi:CrcB protein
MSAWLAVAAGGALGSVARYGVNQVARHLWPDAEFPWATALVNIFGCLAIGFLAGLELAGSSTFRPPWRELLIVGILGGFTTFSTFGLETMTLIRSGQGSLAVANIAVQVVVGLAAVAAGVAAAAARGGQAP